MSHSMKIGLAAMLGAPMSEDDAVEFIAKELAHVDATQRTKHWKEALLAMPLAFPGTGLYSTRSSTSVKQYAILDLEREGLVELADAMQMVNDYVHGAFTPSRAVPAPEWRCTSFGEKVASRLRKMASA